jgi:hypothetical protein
VGDTDRQAASTADVEVGVVRTAGVVGIRRARRPPDRAWSELGRGVGPVVGAPGAVNGVALASSVDPPAVSPGSSAAVISVISTNGVASRSEPI